MAEETSIDVATHKFVVPKKCISGPQDMKKWENSMAYNELIGFILAMDSVVRGKKLSDSCHISQVTEKLLKMLEKLAAWIDEIPAIDAHLQRFGNKAFRTWFKKFSENSKMLLEEALPQALHLAIPELNSYLIDSFGNETRIDYGTGHEASFVFFLCALFKIGALKTKEDSEAAVLKLFAKYMDLVRKLQKSYRMEPAGSHGVWSLDDFQFIPFIWGSAQLIGHPRISPSSFPDADIAASFAKDYLFLACIDYINKVKTGPFSEHSNQLWNISGVQKWEKVNSGLVKMYKAEVLAKFPVVQHVLFGSMFTLDPVHEG